jgi:hypothetical protein
MRARRDETIAPPDFAPTHFKNGKPNTHFAKISRNSQSPTLFSSIFEMRCRRAFVGLLGGLAVELGCAPFGL